MPKGKKYPMPGNYFLEQWALSNRLLVMFIATSANQFGQEFHCQVVGKHTEELPKASALRGQPSPGNRVAERTSFYVTACC